MINGQTEIQERQYLKEVLKKLDTAVIQIDKMVKFQGRQIQEATTHLQEHKRDMDHLEKNVLRESISNMSLQGSAALSRKKSLLRLKQIPYFGRIDFTENKKKSIQQIYIGAYNFKEEKTNKSIIYDWRAPIASMFYDFENGPASYQIPEGLVEGRLLLKRQYKIRNGQMEYLLDNEVAIRDEVLQRELKEASSGKMKNIVATIQREQNQIIRNEEATHLIIQGVAGSGKTSIALHRIAFLLYKYKEDISSEDILILSPNKVFSSYIANVLPELGEKTVAETSLEDIASHLFDHRIKFQSFLDQVTQLLEKPSPKLIERIEYKASHNLIKKIDEYLIFLENTAFKAHDIFINKKPVPAWFIEEKFKQYNRLPILKRFNEVVREIVDNIFLYYKYEVKGAERAELHATVRKMYPFTNLRVLYKDFYKWLQREDLIKSLKGGGYEYGDVYPLLYLKMILEGLPSYNHVKHLVIDEMQDYSPVQYKVLSSLFRCKKTILGDINQSVNPYSSSTLENLTHIFPNATAVSLKKSYRSTFEITEFSKKISDKVDVEPLERHGEIPNIEIFKTRGGQLSYIKHCLNYFTETSYNTLAIIVKTQKEVTTLKEELQESYALEILDGKGKTFNGGIIITTAHLAKGLEFDMVIVPNCSTNHYSTPIDQQMLYVACTRAMHRLTITTVKDYSNFLKQ
jgi:DNA helicase-2/ATP-dependent DNA helicase PcrA